MSIARYRTKNVGNTAPVFLGTKYNLNFPYCTFINPQSCYSSTRRPELEETCQDFLNPGPPYRVGHEFLLRRKTAQYIDSESVTLQNYFYKYVGKFAINSGASEVDAAFASYGATAQTYGAQAFKRFRPVQPRMGLGQALGELKDFPSLFKWQLRKFQDLGSNYLNYKFGWRPFLKDIMDFIDLQKKLERHIAYVRKNNNKWLKRKGILRDETTSTTSNTGSMIPDMVSYLTRPYGSVPRVTRTLIVKDKVWFEAKMKYYIPKLNVDSAEDMWSSPLLRKLYGLEITPSLLWKLTPFTWLADWIVNIGDVYENLTNQAYDNLVAKYAYVMRHRSTSVVYTGTLSTSTGLFNCQNGQVQSWYPVVNGPTPIARAVFTAECKERAKATQWGFGNEGGSLTDRQLMILLALGIQRA